MQNTPEGSLVPRNVSRPDYRHDPHASSSDVLVRSGLGFGIVLAFPETPIAVLPVP